MNILIIIISGSALMYYYLHNQNREIERFYYKKHKALYGVLQIVCFIIMISFFYNMRFIIVNYTSKLLK
jgi:hypothetical protein